MLDATVIERRIEDLSLFTWGTTTAHRVEMTNTTFINIDLTDLTSVTGGMGVGETISNVATGVKNFAGGAAAGFALGPNARTSTVERVADTSSRATKAGFEIGAMGNMALGPLGRAVSAGVGAVVNR